MLPILKSDDLFINCIVELVYIVWIMKLNIKIRLDV